MKNELKYGRVQYASFIILDVICLICANVLAAWLYLNNISALTYGYDDYRSVVVFMVAVDIFVTFAFHTLRRVLRRRKRRELLEGVKHVTISFVALSVILFTIKAGADYSRVTVYLAYIIYFVLFVASHIIWKSFLKLLNIRGDTEKAILLSTDQFVEEGLEELKKREIDIRNIYLLKNIKRDSINDVSVVKTWEEVAAVICWGLLDRVFIYGIDSQMIPEPLVAACREMGLRLDTVDFNFRVIDINTIKHQDPKYGALSFLEGKRDIPFPIRRVYWITETEADLHRGFHAHKLNCQLLYCPHGKIDILLDDGKRKSVVTLDEPGKGLMLMPGLWREMVWKESGSVLCVLASEYYDEEEYIRDYDEFIEYNSKQDPEITETFNRIPSLVYQGM